MAAVVSHRQQLVDAMQGGGGATAKGLYAYCFRVAGLVAAHADGPERSRMVWQLADGCTATLDVSAASVMDDDREGLVKAIESFIRHAGDGGGGSDFVLSPPGLLDDMPVVDAASSSFLRSTPTSTLQSMVATSRICAALLRVTAEGKVNVQLYVARPPTLDPVHLIPLSYDATYNIVATRQAVDFFLTVVSKISAVRATTTTMTAPCVRCRRELPADSAAFAWMDRELKPPARTMLCGNCMRTLMLFCSALVDHGYEYADDREEGARKHAREVAMKMNTL